MKRRGTSSTGLTRRVLAGAVLLAASPVLAEDIVVCTPEFYYNSSETPPIVIPIDTARAAGSRVTRINLETGDFREHFIGNEGNILETGRLKVVNPGSMRERVNFVALDPGSALLLHLSFVDENLPFVRVDPEGTVASGHCAYEIELDQ